jgi:glycosyltransferase involved in cell wall biosynthesis
MIVGFEAKRVFENCSGLGNYGRNTVSLLAKYFPANRYRLFALKKTDLFSLPNSVDTVTPKANLSKLMGAWWRIREVSNLLKTNNIDVFHGLSHLLPFGIERTGVPSVLTVHDLIYLRYPQFYKKIDRELYLAFTRSSCHRATKILAISHQTKADLIHFFGLDPEKIEVIHQSCNNLFYQKISEEQKYLVRQKFNLPKKFILCVGTIEQRKNQLSILEGVVDQKLDIPVVLLGKPTEYKRILDEFIKESDIRKQLLFLPNTNITELQAIYQLAEIMVYPSLYEGFGLPVLEAQASGCPVITSNKSSLPEAGGDGAIYIDPENSHEIGLAIRNILTNNELRQELIRKGNANAQLFKDQIVAGKLMRLYQSVVATSVKTELIAEISPA